MKCVVFLSALVLSLLLCGCSTCKTITNTLSASGVDNTPDPAPLTTVKPERNVTKSWSKSVGSKLGKRDYFKLDPIVTGDAIITADYKGLLVASNPETGERLWSLDTKEKISSGPTVGEGLIVVGTEDAKVVAVNQSNGSILWRANVSDAVLAAPQIGKGLVIAKTIDGKLLALDARSGHPLWSYDHGAPALVMHNTSAPQIYNDKVITGFSDGKLAAISLDHGRMVWEQPLTVSDGLSQVAQVVDIVDDPVIRDGVAYIATYDGKLSAVNATTGSVLWQRDIPSPHGLTVNKQLVFVVDSKSKLWALKRATGDVVWQQDQLGFRNLTPPTLIADQIAVGDLEGYLHLLSQKNGHQTGRILVEKNVKILASPARLGNEIYVLNTYGNLSALQVD